MHNFKRLAALLAVLPVSVAVTVISDETMQSYLSAAAIDLAYNYAPVFFFGQAMDQVPCIPDWAFDGSKTSPDIYDSAHLTPPAPQCQYPDVGCGCRNPGVGIGNPAPQFPIYYTYDECSDAEVRVAYNLFYQKDGAEVGSIQTGHNYDWERIIIIHLKNTTANTWQPTTALYSEHSGYYTYAWGDIQNTLTTEQAEAGDGPDPNGIQDQDHPKVYVAWSKHSNFDTRNTGWNDPASQSTGNAFRSQDWWTFVEQHYFILSDLSTATGQAMNAVDWGDANSDPPYVQNVVTYKVLNTLREQIGQN